jgi:hypothetical protein
MTIVSSFNVDTQTFTHHQPLANGADLARVAWRQAVAEVAERAKATLPECHDRVDSAIRIVLAGDVELQADGTAKVVSQSNGTTRYFVVNGVCECPDYAKAPSHWCKHRIAAGLYKRAVALGKAKVAAATTPPVEPPGPAQASPSVASTPLPEAPVSITLKGLVHGHEVLVTLRGTDLASVNAQVEDASQWLQARTTPAPAASTPECPQHGPMKPSTKGQGWYCPTKLANGRWCTGK